MAESVYTQKVVESFDRYFSKEIIAGLHGEKAYMKYRDFFNFINFFRYDMTQQYAQLVLSGDHLINEINDIDTLLGRLDILMSNDLNEGDIAYLHINEEVDKLLQDIRIATKLVQFHAKTINDYYEHNAEAYVIDSNELRKGKSAGTVYVDILKVICDLCLAEYRFSYDEGYIRMLLLYRARIVEFSNLNIPSTIHAVIWAALEKVEFLLSKLALYSKNKKISYNIDYQTHTITLNEENNQSDDNAFRRLCLYFYDPKRITEKEAIQWLEEANQKNSSMWTMVFLMRYYCKCTQSIQQIDNLLRLGERHYEEYQREERNKVNDRASKFFINYLYNSRFSFLCKNLEQYRYEEMKKDLNHIAMIQDNTGIHNYHPYQKACDYMIEYIKAKLRDTTYTQTLKEEWNFLNDCYKRLRENTEWCSHHQPYLMQFLYKFSTIKTEFGDIQVYFPSSVSRPLKFREIEEKVIEIGNAVQWLDLQIEHQEEKAKIVEAQKKIEGIENANLKHLGYFISVTSFLIGLLSIFIGNEGGVSIYEKMEYVTALGIILLLFVGVGYFALTDNIKNKSKYWTLFVLLVALAGVFGWESHKGFANLKDSKEAQKEEQVEETKAKAIKAKMDTLVIEVNAKVETEGHVVTVSESPKKGNTKEQK